MKKIKLYAFPFFLLLMLICSMELFGENMSREYRLSSKIAKIKAINHF